MRRALLCPRSLRTEAGAAAASAAARRPTSLPLPVPLPPTGLHNLLLLCIARVAVLLCIGATTCRALYHRRAPHSPLAGASPRSSLVQAAVCLQLLWLAAEVLLGSALLLSRPPLSGELRGIQRAGGVESHAVRTCSSAAHPHGKLLCPCLGVFPAQISHTCTAPPTLFYTGASLTEASDASGPLAALLSLLPLALAAAMSGCFLFLSRLGSGRRQRSQHGSAPDSNCCPLERGMSRPLQPRSASAQLCSCGSRAGLAPTCSLHSVEVMCSPASSDDDTRSCSSCSSADSAAFYQRASSSYATSYGSSGSAGYLSTGAPSPTGHLCSPGVEEQAQHAAAIQAACEIVLQEHQVRLLAQARRLRGDAAEHAAPTLPCLCCAAALRCSIYAMARLCALKALPFLPPSSPALQLDTNEWVLFVHKRLPAIKTRPEGEPLTMLGAQLARGCDVVAHPALAACMKQPGCCRAAAARSNPAHSLPRPAPPQTDKHAERPGLLRELISNSFSFGKDAAAQVQTQVVAGMAAGHSGGGSAESAISLAFCTEG